MGVIPKLYADIFFNPEIEIGNNLNKLRMLLNSFIKMIHYNTSKVSFCMWSGYIREIIKWSSGNEIYLRKFVSLLPKLVKNDKKKIFIPSASETNI